VDAVVSNPPYVREGERLPPDVAAHEPHLALFAPGDGLEVVRRLVPGAAEAGAGFLAIEVGEGQATVAAELLRSGGFAAVEVVADYAGIDRVVVGRR
jgi:release factor glutamine methyltransferase